MSNLKDKKFKTQNYTYNENEENWVYFCTYDHSTIFMFEKNKKTLTKKYIKAKLKEYRHITCKDSPFSYVPPQVFQKKTKVDKCYIVADLIENGYLDKEFVLYTTQGSSMMLAELGDYNVIKNVYLEDLKKSLTKFCVHYKQYLNFSPEDIRKTMTLFLDKTDVIRNPLLFRFRYEIAHALHVIPFDVDLSGATTFDTEKYAPHWHDILMRCSNPEMFCAFLGSLFDRDSDLQHYLWMYGAGQNSKSTILNVLHWAFGPTYCSSMVLNDDKFWTYDILNKRIVAFADCKEGFIESHTFKSLTGGDLIRIEPKGKQAYNIKPTCKLIFASNARPEISNTIADKRRIIMCSFEPIKGEPMQHYPDLLKNEAFYFFNYCFHIYKKNSINGKLIYNYNESIDIQGLVEESNAEYERVFKNSFVLDERQVSENEKYRFSATELDKVVNYHCNDKNKKQWKKKFLDYIMSTYKIVYKPIKVKGKVVWTYVGAYVNIGFRDLDSEQSGKSHRP
jgi:hypothetical protein